MCFLSLAASVAGACANTLMERYVVWWNGTTSGYTNESSAGVNTYT